MANLVIDIGNTRIKSALFEKAELVWEGVFDELPDAIDSWSIHKFDNCLVSSVRWTKEELQQFLSFDFIYLTSQTEIPISNSYGSPATLGLDRIAAAIGGWQFAGKGPVLVIDLGSCITFEFVNQDNDYLGGAISPGLTMRAKAMNSLTARLPLVEVAEKPKNRIGDSTITCMQIGIWYGVEYELIGQIQAYEKEYPKIKVFVCGGDAQSFVSLAKDHIFVVPNLVLHGLNCILNHNVE
ncbi:MAG: type III pantothenate kinase [Algoriphagus sp.]|nr:type III pantothenate kinase [Algoriphagus sp.]